MVPDLMGRLNMCVPGAPHLRWQALDHLVKSDWFQLALVLPIVLWVLTA